MNVEKLEEYKKYGNMLNYSKEKTKQKCFRCRLDSYYNESKSWKVVNELLRKIKPNPLYQIRLYMKIKFVIILN